MTIIHNKSKPSPQSRYFIKPEPNKFLKMALHPTPKYDPLLIAEKGINKQLAFERSKFNVLQILSSKDLIEDSYAKVDEDNTIYEKEDEHILFNPNTIKKIRILFDVVDNYILMGDAITDDVGWRIYELLCIKGHHADKRVYNAFKHFQKEYPKISTENWPDISTLNLKNGKELNIHFDVSAMYPHPSEIPFYEATGGHVRKLELISWNDVKERIFESTLPGFEIYVQNKLFEKLFEYNRGILKYIGMRADEYVNGEYVIREKESKCNIFNRIFSRKQHFRINLFFWTSFEEFKKFMTIN